MRKKGMRLLAAILCASMVFGSVDAPMSVVRASENVTLEEAGTTEESVEEKETTDNPTDESSSESETVIETARESVEETEAVSETEKASEDTTQEMDTTESGETEISDEQTNEEVETETTESTVVDEETSEEDTTEEKATEILDESSISAVDTALAKIKNLEVEYVGYQTAKIIFEVECSDEDILSGYGGVICSYNTFSIEDSYLNWEYEDDGTQKYYLTVKVQPGVELSYTPYVNVKNSDNTEEKISASNSIQLTGLRFNKLVPDISIQPYVGMAKLELVLANNTYNESFGIKTRYRIKGTDEWTEHSGVEWRSGIGNVYLLDLQAATSYEVYVEVLDKNGTTDSVQTKVYDFTTGEDKEYTREHFPDEEFYNWLLDATNSTELTQSKLDQLSNTSFTVLTVPSSFVV